MGLQQTSWRWKVIGKSVQGEAHKLADKPCQDAIQWYEGDNFAVLAVADGHGSEHCPYSDKGAQFAVEVAVEILRGLYKGFSSEGEFRNYAKDYAEDQLPRKIVREWTKRVKNDHAKKLSEVASDSDPQKEEEILIKYGTTLLAALLTVDFLLLLQLGDGDMLAVADDGTVERPIPKDERLIANFTTSLCMPNAWKEVRIALLPNYDKKFKLILLSTDGYANSYKSDQDFMQVGADYLNLVREEGIEWVGSQLEEWLNEVSVQGSRDDITVGLAFLSAIPDGSDS